jgi:hypothetical protein
MTPVQLHVLVEARAKQAQGRQGAASGQPATTVGTPADFAQLAALAARSVRG